MSERREPVRAMSRNAKLRAAAVAAMFVVTGLLVAVPALMTSASPPNSASSHATPSIGPAGVPIREMFKGTTCSAVTTCASASGNLAHLGDSVFVFIDTNTSTLAISGVADNAGNSLTQVGSYVSTTPGSPDLTLWVYDEGAVAKGGMVIWVNVSTSATYTFVWAAFYSSPAAPVDLVGTIAEGHGTSISGTATANTPSDQVLMGIAVSGTSTISASGRATLIDDQTTAPATALLNQSVVGTGSQLVSATGGTIRNWVAIVITLSPGTYPTAPGTLTQTGETWTTVTLGWVAPPGPVINYSEYHYTDTAVCTGTQHSSNQVAPATGTTFGSLSPGVEYSAEVSAFNSTGEGARSGCAVAYTLPSGASGATATAAVTSVTVNWVNPTTTPRTGVLRDDLLYYEAGSSCSSPSEIDIGSVVSTYTITGLSMNTLYCAYVVPVDPVGNGNASNTATATTNNRPAAPSGITETGVTLTSISFRWTNPTTGGLLNDTVYYKVASACGAGMTGISLGAVQSSYDLMGLVTLTTYAMEVTAWNATGESPDSGCLVVETSGIGTFTINAQTATETPAFWGTYMDGLSYTQAQRTALNNTNIISMKLSGNQMDEENWSNGCMYVGGSGGGCQAQQEDVLAYASLCQNNSAFQCELYVPGEINSPSTVAYLINWLVAHDGGWLPYCWAIGNEPEDWTHFNIPWTSWGVSDASTVTDTQYAQDVLNITKTIRHLDPGSCIVGLESNGNPSHLPTWLPALSAAVTNLTQFAYHYDPTVSVNCSATSIASWLGATELTTAFVDYATEGAPNAGGLPLGIHEYHQKCLLGTEGEAAWFSAGIAQGLELGVGSIFFLRYAGSGSDGLASMVQPNGSTNQVYDLYPNLFAHMDVTTVHNVTMNIRNNATFAVQGEAGPKNNSLLIVNAHPTDWENYSLTGIDPSNWTGRIYMQTGYGDFILPYTAGMVLTIPNQSEAVVQLAAPPFVYAVTFTETGLPSGATWYVTYNGTEMSSTSTTIVFNMPNGTYAYNTSAPGYTASPSSGNHAVAGAPTGVGITFTPNVAPPPPSPGNWTTLVVLGVLALMAAGVIIALGNSGRRRDSWGR